MNRQEALRALNELDIREEMDKAEEAVLFALCAKIMKLNNEEFEAALNGVALVRTQKAIEKVKI